MQEPCLPLPMMGRLSIRWAIREGSQTEESSVERGHPARRRGFPQWGAISIEQSKFARCLKYRMVRSCCRVHAHLGCSCAQASSAAPSCTHIRPFCTALTASGCSPGPVGLSPSRSAAAGLWPACQLPKHSPVKFLPVSQSVFLALPGGTLS